MPGAKSDLWQMLVDLENKLSGRRISYMLTVCMVKASSFSILL